MNTLNSTRPSRHLHSTVVTILAALCLTFATLPACAATRTVTSTSDSGAGSLRQTITDAIAGDTINFATNLSGQSITLTSGELLINKALYINGSSVAGGITISGNNASRIFYLQGGSVTMSSLALTAGKASGVGGAIFISSGVTLTVFYSTLSANTASHSGGAIYSEGNLSLTNCTLSGNTSGGEGIGGGIANLVGPLSLSHCTLAGNAANYGGGFFTQGSLPVTIINSIVAGNIANSGSLPDIWGSSSGPVFVIGGANLIGDNSSVEAFFPAGPLVGTSASPLNPLLAPLGNYGGPTQTMPPLPGSPAIDAVAFAYGIDQRGFTRPKDGDGNGTATPDIGAVEVGTTYVVTTAADQNDGVSVNGISLRDAINDTPPIPDARENRVVFDTAVFNGEPADTITLSSGQLLINKNLTIDASSVSNGVTVSGNNASRVFEIAAGNTVTMNNLTITRGNSVGGTFAQYGGGVLNLGTLFLTNSSLTGNFSGARGGAIASYLNTTGLRLDNCTLSSNSAADVGGAIVNYTSCSLNNCTLSGNTSLGSGGAQSFGGAIFNFNYPLTLNNCTLSSNAATTYGGGLRSQGGTVTIKNTIIAGNTAALGGDINNVGATSIISGANLIGNNETVTTEFPAGPLAGTAASPLNPLLAPLGNYGGPTQTMPPLAGSPALNLSSSGLATDQRGVARPQSANFDLGAAEGFFLNLSQTAGDVTLSWPAVPFAMSLKSSPSMTGPWANATSQANPQTFTVAPGTPRLFFLLGQ